MIWPKPASWRPRAGPGENASRCLRRTLRRQAKRLARRGASWKLRLMNQAIWTPLSLAVVLVVAVAMNLSAGTKPSLEFKSSPSLQTVVDRAANETLAKFAATKLETNQLAIEARYPTQ